MQRLIFTGDILPANRPHTPGIGTGSHFLKSKGDNWLSFFEAINPEYDLLFGNLESPLVSNSNREKQNMRAFAGDPEFAGWLKRAGYDLVSVANNHILEFGEEGLKNTAEILRDIGVQPVGFYDEEAGSNLVVIEKNIPPSHISVTSGRGIDSGNVVSTILKIGFAAFNEVHDIRIKNCYAQLNTENVKKAISALKKKKVDLICLSFHWGNEYIHYPSWQQIELGRKAIDYGADLIIGHHPHVVQPVERYKHGYIVYSLGNFIFDMNWAKHVKTGMCLVFEADMNGIISCTTHAVEIQDDYTPVLCNNDPWLNEILQTNLVKMHKLHDKGQLDYEKVYKKELKKNRMYARIGMKRQLLRQWFSIPKKERKIIIKQWFG